MQDLINQPVPTEDKDFFESIVNIIDQNYPTDWREWKIVDISFSDLFGKELTSKVEAKLRFALPMQDLRKTFAPDGDLSERRYRAIKRKLIQWPLGRAILYAPHSIMEKIHQPSYYAFMQTVREMKVSDKLTARSSSASSQRATPTRKRAPPDDDGAATPSTCTSSKVPRQDTPTVPPPAPPVDAMQKIMEILASQSQILESLTKRVDGITASLTNIEAENSASELDQSFESVPDSTHSGDEWQAPTLEPLPESQEKSVPQEEILRSQIIDAQRKLGELKSVSEYILDFSPNTAEVEPKLAKANTKLAEQGKKCQRLGDDGWKNIRYADVQKSFQATPVFCALKINSQLASATPSWQTVPLLEKADLTLGAITHGLLQQRDALQEACKNLSPAAQQELHNVLLTPESNFRKVSDSLLQYTCGRRAEIIQQRREIFKPANKTLYEVLHDIPPSETHLFTENKLAETIKEQGGLYKFFPVKRSPATKPRTSQNNPRRFKTLNKSMGSKKPAQANRKPYATSNKTDTNNKQTNKPFLTNRKY